MGVDRDTVTAQAGTGVEGHKAERFGSGGVDYFPNVEIQAVAHEGNFVDQTDINRAEGVFQQLDHFGGLS